MVSQWLKVSQEITHLQFSQETKPILNLNSTFTSNQFSRTAVRLDASVGKLIRKWAGFMYRSTPSPFCRSLNKLVWDKNSKHELCYWVACVMLPERIIHRIRKGSAELQHEQISLFCPYLITGPLEGERDLDAVLEHRLIIKSSWSFNVLNFSLLLWQKRNSWARVSYLNHN